MAGTATLALSIESLRKQFGALHVLTDVTLGVEPGERRVLLGPNGAGKTTLFNVVSGVYPATSGRVLLNGREIGNLPPYRRAAAGLSRTFQLTSLFPNLTLRHNVVLALQGLSRRKYNFWRLLASENRLLTRADELLERWQMRDRATVRVKELSYGDQRQIEILMAVAQEPRVLLLDEPTAGLSAVETARVVEIVHALPRDISMLIIEHDMDVAFSLADSLSVLYMGSLIVTGDAATIRASDRVREIYLGEMAATFASVAGEEQPT